MSKLPVTIEWSQAAAAALRNVGSRTVQQKIAQKVLDVAASPDPEQLGKPLQDELRGLFRISFGRCRILYHVRREMTRDGREITRMIVRVVLLSIRKHGDKIDVYELARRLKRQGRL